VNFITAHDGFTLNDVVSYNDKHNDANGEDNRDGTSNNHSWNHGVEGVTAAADIIALRERQKRNMLATLLLSQGTPMILAGDEFGRTQEGNNNAYCQDNEVSWIDWNHSPEGEVLARFVSRLTQVRRHYHMLHRNRFLTGQWNEEFGVKDATWYTPAAIEMTPEAWNDSQGRCMGVVLDGRAQATGIRKRGSDVTLLLLLNAHHETIPFTLPDGAGGEAWERLIDTFDPDEAGGRAVRIEIGNAYDLSGRSLSLFKLIPKAAG
jgi:glycogen operon protein